MHRNRRRSSSQPSELRPGAKVVGIIGPCSPPPNETREPPPEANLAVPSSAAWAWRRHCTERWYHPQPLHSPPNTSLLGQPTFSIGGRWGKAKGREREEKMKSEKEEKGGIHYNK